MNNISKEKSEIVIPYGYLIDEVIDMDDDFEEQPIIEEEVFLRFERGKE